MAGQPATIDPSALASWEDVFQYPLPVVRKLEQQLGRTIVENREKLRSLVGASYRDLLGTAERIITMDEQMSAVEAHLSEIGKRCNTRTLERVVDNSARMRRMRENEDHRKYAVIAQTKILQGALAVVGKVIKMGGDALLAAKVLVLARLLHKSASESSQAPPVLHVLRKKLVALRRRLLSYIERALVRPRTDKMSLAHTMGAYALVTSSASKDVLRHFLQVRYEQLEVVLESASEAGVLQILELYSQTRLDTRDLFPRRFAETLSQLTRAPLLQDEELRSIPELSLDVYGSWVAEDVRAFMPWVRHDQLVSSDVAEALHAWTKQAQQSLLQGLKTCLELQHDAAAILGVRQKVMSRYLAFNSKLRNEDHVHVVKSLRRAFLQRFEKLAHNSAHSFQLSMEPSETIQPPPIQDLWTLASSNAEIYRGGSGLRKAVLQMRHGRNSALDGQIQVLDSLFERLDTFWVAADTMCSSKWDEAGDFDFDDMEDGEALQNGLIKDDPDELQGVLRLATKDAVDRIYQYIQQASTQTVQPAFVIRILREVDQRTQNLGHRLPVPVSTLRDSRISTNMYRQIAEDVSRAAIEEYVVDLQKATSTTTTLWEGSPPLPAQPSPATFKFLMSLHRAMDGVGNDLWSPACVAQVKTIVQERLFTELERLDFDNAATKTAALTDGHAEGEEEAKVDESSQLATSDDQRNCRRVQQFFDILYLQRVLIRQRTDQDHRPLNGIVAELNKDIVTDPATTERLSKSAREYWGRTCLLFGLLASGQR